MGRAPWFRGFELSRAVRARPRMQQGSVRSVVVVVFFFLVLLCLCVRAFFRFRFLDFFFVFFVFVLRFRGFFWVGLSRAVRGYTNPILS